MGQLPSSHHVTFSGPKVSYFSALLPQPDEGRLQELVRDFRSLRRDSLRDSPFGRGRASRACGLPTSPRRPSAECMAVRAARPRENAMARYRTGHHAAEAKAERRELRALIRELRSLIDSRTRLARRNFAATAVFRLVRVLG